MHAHFRHSLHYTFASIYIDTTLRRSQGVVYIRNVAAHWLILHSASARLELKSQRQELLEEIRKEEANLKGAGVPSAEGLTRAAAVDSFDTLMSSVETQVEADKVFRPNPAAQSQWTLKFLLKFSFPVFS